VPAEGELLVSVEEPGEDGVQLAGSLQVPREPFDIIEARLEQALGHGKL
jgi:hypothetical protein